MKKFISFILALLMMIPIFGCTDVPEETLPQETTSPETEKEETYLELIENGELLYTLVRPEKCSTTLFSAIKSIKSTIEEKLGISVKDTDDWVQGKPMAGEYISEGAEILVGETNRRESREVYLTLSVGEYAIRAVGNKIVIIGYNDNLTVVATERFINDYIVAAEGGETLIPESLNIIDSAYSSENGKKDEAIVENITPVGELFKAETEKWVACEIEFESSKEYENPVYTVDTDVVFYNKTSGTALKVPAFWDGGTSWKVRFAPTEVGEWSFYTVCTDTANSGLHHRGGRVICKEYSGDLDIYKHGFVKTEPGKNYFVYDDGTPFFYLGDTHWTLAIEEIDGYGSVETQKVAGITKELADQYGITSQFDYIMNYRAEQGYTVIQSQPLYWWDVNDQIWFQDGAENIFTLGVNDFMLEKFEQYDRYFKIIADYGLVHSNTQFGYPTTLMSAYFGGKITDEQLEKLSRYWVARYSAYPVMWATTQEGDNDYYGVDRGDCEATPETNPWLKVIDYVHKYDAYNHPSTCHQEHWSFTSVGNSNFGKLESHTWYASQYNTPLNSSINWELMREYWNNPGSKPVVNYEGRYDHFWTGTEGSRAQGWIAYMNGQVGYGYGVQPIWSIFWAQNGITDFNSKDESGEFRMDANWVEGLYADAGRQVSYIKSYLSKYEWWRLTPCFNTSYFYVPGSCKYSVCHIGNELYLGYFYGNNTNGKLGKFTAMANGEYEVQWFSCITGEYGDAFTVTVTDGTYTLPAKPDAGDWVISVKIKK